MGSYNYLGFAQNDTDFLKTVADTTRQYGVGVSGTRQEMGEWRLFSSSSACLLPFYVFEKKRLVSSCALKAKLKVHHLFKLLSQCGKINYTCIYLKVSGRP